MVKKTLSIIAFLLSVLTSFCQNTEITTFYPGTELVTNFNSYIDNIGKDYSKEHIQSIKSNFTTIIKHNKFNYFYEEQLCNSLNCLSAYNSSFSIVNTFVSAFANMLNSNFTDNDCSNWVKSICNLSPDLQLFNLWKDFFADNTVSITSYSKWQVISPAKIELSFSNETPYVIFENGILTCPLNDSIKIHDCSGEINLLTKELSANGGSIFWEKAGMNKDTVFAKLPEIYHLTLDNITITIEAVKLYHKKYFQGTALLGSITDRCVQGSNTSNARYPKFNAYSDNPISIRNIYPNMNYVGGFELDGSQIIGSGKEKQDAEITIFREGKSVITLTSKRFNFKKDGFAAGKVDFTLITKNDTISHANAGAKYMLVDNVLDIIRDPDSRGGAPFSSTYHKLNIYCEQLRWKLNTDEIIFTSSATISKEGRAFFESKNFFSKDRFRQFETADGTNSILQLLQYSRKYTDEFYLYEYAEYLRKGQEQVKASLLLISNFELIDYDLERDRIKVNKKLHDYVAAYSENRDYDIISAYSNVKGIDNAVLDFEKDLLTIEGVSELVFSEQNNVILFPTNNRINILDELTIEFGGYLQAGLVDFYIQSGIFDYHNFKMKLSQVDSMSFFINTGKYDQYGKPVVSKVNSPIQNLSGTLEINKHFNKSGNLDFPEYPIFTCDDFAHIYYDNPAICNQVYNRDEFYFLVDPFSIDSLQSFLPQNLSLDGEFVSAGIFPNFREKATIMPDLSLGFTHNTPNTGYPMYGGKGKFYNTIILSNDCLKGKGQIDYITASLKSEDFAIYPDSTNAIVERLNIDELVSKVEYPQVYGNTSKMHWNVTENYMDFSTVTGDPYYMFHNFLTLDGNIQYSPEYLKGNGIITKDNGKIHSDDFDFKAHNLYADSSHFQLFLPGNKYLAVDADNYNVFLNVTNKSADFVANNKTDCGLNFKENAYFVEFDKFEWKIDNNSLALGDKNHLSNILNESVLNSLLDTGAEGYLATALGKKADSLQFYAKAGLYDGDAFVLTLSGIDYIEVSDAAVFPLDGSVKITAGGTMMPITDGFAIFNLTERYHTLYNINLSIESKNVFKGSAYYNYIDVTDNITPIFVENVSSTKEQVRGRAVISELSPLLLNPVVEYQGMVSIYNTSPKLDFNGYYNVKQVCFENNTWIKLQHGADPENLQLPANESILSIENKPIYSGMIFSNPGANIYPAFLSSKNKIPDIPMFNVEGMLSFNGNIYTISDTTNNTIFPKENLTLNAADCIMDGSGAFNLMETPGRLSIETAGELNYNLMTDSIIMEIALFLDFHFNETALNILSGDIQNSPQYGGQFTGGGNKYYTALSHLISETEFETYYNETSNYGIPQNIPQLLKSKIVISNVKLTWDNIEKVFYSTGPISISYINGQIVNKTLNGVVEISKFGGTESISIMFLAKNAITQQDEKYFFFYHNNNMFTYSTNDSFSNLIRNDSKKVRRLKREGKLPPYQYIIATSDRLLSFSKKYGL
ncbi:MAG: hypothetical protein LBP67_07650 [Bacteroidales bacterium]|jgi:hypothetical protein|nr:hypothetical protein [Bacteroidales bacterium]